MIRCLLLLLAFCVSSPLLWAQPSASNDPIIEARLQALSEELRCLVCQNETLAESRADLAIDMRDEIRSLMVNGASDQEVIDYLVARYGDFVRFRPPLKATTLALWFGPFILAALGCGFMVYYLARRRLQANDAPLAEIEQRRLDSLLHGMEEDTKR